MIMPVHKMTAVLSTRPGTRPNEPSTAAFAPPAALSAKMPRQESATSIKMKHKKPINPIGSAFHAQKRRENKVPGTEEHGEQGQSGNQSVFLQECSFMELRPKCLL